MGYNKLTGAQAILGGAVILTSPTIYTNLSTATSSMKIYGTPVINASATDATKAGITYGGATRYIKKIAFTGGTSSQSWTTSVTCNFNTGFQLPTSALVTDAWFQITTIGSSITLTAGTTADPNGFLTGMSPAMGVQAGSLTAGAITYGVLLADQLTTTIPAWGKVNYAPQAAVWVSIGRSATNLTNPSGNLFIEYIVPGV